MLDLARFCVFACLLACFGTALGCGGGAKATNAPVNPDSDGAQAPILSQSSGATPIHAFWDAGGCQMEMRDGLGASYRFDPEDEQRVVQTLQKAMNGCISPKGMQGTLYVEGKVAGTGALTEAVVSPGGAVSTDVVICLTEALARVQLAVPKESASGLLLFVVSACQAP